MTSAPAVPVSVLLESLPAIVVVVGGGGSGEPATGGCVPPAAAGSTRSSFTFCEPIVTSRAQSAMPAPEKVIL